MRADAGYWIALSKVTGIGAGRLRRLWECFGDMQVAWKAAPSDLQRAGLDARTVAAIVAERGRCAPRKRPGTGPERRHHGDDRRPRLSRPAARL